MTAMASCVRDGFWLLGTELGERKMLSSTRTSVRAPGWVPKPNSNGRRAHGRDGRPQPADGRPGTSLFPPSSNTGGKSPQDRHDA